MCLVTANPGKTIIPDNQAEAIAAYIAECTEQLRQQAERVRGWPDPLRLPIPQNDDERQALNLWIAELQRGTGAAINIVFPPKL